MFAVMKTRVIVSAFLSLLLLTACDDRREAMMQTVEKTLVADRAFQQHVSALPMEKAVEWAETHGTDDERQKAHYVMGRVYSDLEQKGRALRSYQKAAAEGDPQGEFALLAYSHIGNLLLADGDNAKALEWFRRTLDMATPKRDTVTMIFALRDMARCLQQDEEMVGAAVNCMNRAEELMCASNHEELSDEISPEHIMLSLRVGDGKTARHLLGRLLQRANSQVGTEVSDRGPMWLSLGRVYQAVGQEDSARICLQRALASDNLKTHASAAMLLSQQDAHGEHYEEAWLNAMETVAVMDSLNSHTMKEQRSMVESLTDQLLVERENHLLRWRWVLTIVVAVTVVVLTAWGYHRRVRKLRVQAERYRQARELMRRRSTEYMETAEAHVTELSKQIERASQDKDRLQEQLLIIRREQEEQRLLTVRTRQERHERLLAAFRQTELCRRLTMMGNGTVGGMAENELWEELEKFLNDYDDNFVLRLLAFCPRLKTNDLHLCMLLKLEFTNVEVSNIFHRTQQASTNARKRLYTKLFNREGSADELTRFVLAF